MFWNEKQYTQVQPLNNYEQITSRLNCTILKFGKQLT